MIEVFESIANMYSNTGVNRVTILAVLIVTLLLSIYEFLVYRFVSKKSFYNKAFNITIAVMPFFIATIILCLQSNIVITLGTIGALAIIRFRTAVKDPVDMLYLLWSTYIGIICGCQLYEVAVLTSILVTFVLLALEHIKFGKKPYVLIVKAKSDIESELIEIFNSEGVSYKFKSRIHSDKAVDYAVELTINNIQSLSDKLSSKKTISKYSIIEYDADDIV